MNKRVPVEISCRKVSYLLRISKYITLKHFMREIKMKDHRN